MVVRLPVDNGLFTLNENESRSRMDSLLSMDVNVQLELKKNISGRRCFMFVFMQCLNSINICTVQKQEKINHIFGEVIWRHKTCDRKWLWRESTSVLLHTGNRHVWETCCVSSEFLTPPAFCCRLSPNCPWIVFESSMTIEVNKCYHDLFWPEGLFELPMHFWSFWNVLWNVTEFRLQNFKNWIQNHRKNGVGN